MIRAIKIGIIGFGLALLPACTNVGPVISPTNIVPVVVNVVTNIDPNITNIFNTTKLISPSNKCCSARTNCCPKK